MTVPTITSDSLPPERVNLTAKLHERADSIRANDRIHFDWNWYKKAARLCIFPSSIRQLLMSSIMYGETYPISWSKEIQTQNSPRFYQNFASCLCDIYNVVFIDLQFIWNCTIVWVILVTCVGFCHLFPFTKNCQKCPQTHKVRITQTVQTAHFGSVFRSYRTATIRLFQQQLLCSKFIVWLAVESG